MKKGFTLVELIGVITILGLILILVTPPIINQIKKSKGAIDKVTEELIYSATDLYIDNKVNSYPKTNNNIYCITINDLIKDGKLKKGLSDSNGKEIDTNKFVKITVTNNNYVYSFGDTCEAKHLYKETILRGAIPELKEGIIPVTIENDGTVKKADVNSEWYNYNRKKWANAVTVKASARATIAAAEAGTVIPEGDILTYLVWIPRYKYKLWYTEAADGNSAKDTTKVHSIDIVFEGKNTAKSPGSTNGTYLTHPAFTFGSAELNGIWVGKFEAGYAEAASTSAAQVETADSTKVVIKPNTYSWRNINISNMFNTVKGMNAAGNVFGLTTATDTHMMKNTEWGAVAYLSHSKYGKDAEVYINNNNTYKTGCGGDTASESESSTCKNAYGSKNNGVYNQSTTGNISGIFDMSGGALERVMGYTTGASTKYGTSGFTDETFPDAKYVDVYDSTTDTQYSKRILGDATGEMGPFASARGSWYDDYAYFARSSNPWFGRGGIYYDTTDAGVFEFSRGTGEAHHVYSFRVVAV